MSHVGDMRLLVLGGGVIMLHTMVTVLEEALFRSERFRAEAGSAFMTLVFYVLTVLAYLPALDKDTQPWHSKATAAARCCRDSLRDHDHALENRARLHRPPDAVDPQVSKAAASDGRLDSHP